MNDHPSSAPDTQGHKAPAWGAVLSMTLGVFGLVTAEFLPASLLTPMAHDLSISEALAGQAVSATAIVAMITCLLIATLTRRFDRRHVLLGFSVLLIASNILVAIAPNLSFLLMGRVLLGIALGGFWTMAAAIVMRLVPEHLIPRALSILFSGVSVATVFAAPLGSFLGDIIGWRNIFLLTAGLGVVVLVAQFATLPRLAPVGHASLRTLFNVMMRPRMRFGMVLTLLIFTGHFAMFTYVRPFLENVSGVAVSGISGILLGFGIANFIGTYLAGALIERSLKLTLSIMPIIMGLAGLSLATLKGSSTIGDSILIAIWGMAFAAMPVGWSTWITRTVPDEAESGGGLLVASIQFAIALGAALGGAIYTASGALGVFGLSGCLMLVAGAVVTLRLRPAPQASAQNEA
ncbi:major facilitator transporter [Thalassospira profundimaris]|uniref:Major facilitator transporter n=1 Tax=Thalassospira profundimaris TaxID=502049 RepID=A0A367XIY5_9PROT|nr:MFS transporter [Thalassospira profundimaris]RCK53578.1 major facilitator transporter [Thalassospira profundimaris]